MPSQKFIDPATPVVREVAKGKRVYRIAENDGYFEIYDSEGYQFQASIFTTADRAATFIEAKSAADLHAGPWIGTLHNKI